MQTLDAKKNFCKEIKEIKGEIKDLRHIILDLQNQLSLFENYIPQNEYKYLIRSDFGKFKRYLTKQGVLNDLKISAYTLNKHSMGCPTILDDLGIRVEKL